MWEASCLGYVACEQHERNKTRPPKAFVKETKVACGHHHRAGPHAEGTTQVPIRYSVGRKVAGNTNMKGPR